MGQLLRYYGWDVEDDTGMSGTYYAPKVLRSLDLLELVGGSSDMLTYWRHEFHSYRTAHVQGGTHQVPAKMAVLMGRTANLTLSY